MEKNTKKRNLIITIIVIIIIAIIGLLLFFFRSNISDFFDRSQGNLFPFGDPRSTDIVTPGFVSEGETDIDVSPIEDGFIPLSRERLKRITTVPVLGFAPIINNNFYYSQESILRYNSARGEIDLSSLGVIRSPRLRVSRSSDHLIYDVSVANNSLSETVISDTLIPMAWETSISSDGQYYLTRLYDAPSFVINTFYSRLPSNFNPTYCDFSNSLPPFEPALDFTIGDRHPTIAMVRLLLNLLTNSDTNNHSPEFTEEVVAQLTAVNEDLGLEIDENNINQNTIDTLRQICERELADTANSLPGNIFGELLNIDREDAVMKKSSGEVFIIGPNDGGRTYVGEIFSPSEDIKLVFESRFGEWLSQWNNSEHIFLQTKPSFGVPGHLYKLNPQNKKLEKVVGDKLGMLSVVSPDERHIIISETNGATSRIITSVMNTSTLEQTRLPFRTIAEKCSWSNDSTFAVCAAPISPITGEEPDNWFMGISQYNDTIWIVNIGENGEITSQEIYNPSVSDLADLDIYKIQIDPFDNNYMYFIDKKTSFLWSLEIDGLSGVRE